MAYNSAYTGPQVDSAVGQVVGENIPAGSVKFTDGQTFQQKYDAGQLTGPQGPAGENGATGPQGEPGENATINGVNALTLTVTGGGITGTQTGSTFTLDSTELFTSVSEGKSTIAAAITDKGVTTAADATFQQMATNIAAIQTGGSTATITFSNSPTVYYVSHGVVKSHDDVPGTDDIDIESIAITVGGPAAGMTGDVVLLSQGITSIQQTVKAYKITGSCVS